MKKTYIAPALQSVGLNIETPILDASPLPVNREDNPNEVVGESAGAWTNKRGGWNSSDWSGNE